MAILIRGGAYADFDPSKLKPREWAVVLENDPSAKDGKAIYICFSRGNVKRISTYEDMYDDLLTATDDIKQEYIQAFNEILEEIEKIKTDTEGIKDVAQSKAEESALSAQSAGLSAETATQKAESASSSAADAAGSADESEGFSNLSKSYAIGTNGEVRVGDEVDNSKYYKEECQRLYQNIEQIISSVTTGGLIPAGTIPFEELPESPNIGYMYNISNNFVTDGRFAEGAGISYSRGTNVYWSVDGKWDVLTGAVVLGVKGEAESVYQTGYVNITKESLGLGGLKPVAFSGSYNDLTDIPVGGNVKLTNLNALIESSRRESIGNGTYNYYDAMSGGSSVFVSGQNILRDDAELQSGIYLLDARIALKNGYTNNSKIANRTYGIHTYMELDVTANIGISRFINNYTLGGTTILRGNAPNVSDWVNDNDDVGYRTHLLFYVSEGKTLTKLYTYGYAAPKMPYNSNISAGEDVPIRAIITTYAMNLFKLE